NSVSPTLPAPPAKAKTHIKPGAGPNVLIKCTEVVVESGIAHSDPSQTYTHIGEAEDAAAKAASDAVLQALKTTRLSCDTACPNIQILVSIGTPNGHLKQGGGGFVAECEWKLVIDCDS